LFGIWRGEDKSEEESDRRKIFGFVSLRILPERGENKAADQMKFFADRRRHLKQQLAQKNKKKKERKLES